MEGVEGSKSTWVPPRYNLEQEPINEAKFDVKSDQDFPGNFPRSSKWAPDCSAFLALCENRSFQLFETPQLSIYHDHTDNLPLSQISEKDTRVFMQNNAVLDYVWYPTASVYDPSSFCFMASVRECPVKLLDAKDGRLRASYSIVDHRERHVAPHSMAFSGGGQRLYCGFEDAIELFDVSRPGEGTRLATTPSKKSKDGLKGVISALAFAPNQGSDFFAAGTFTQAKSNIALFDESQGEGPIMFVSGGLSASIQFNPMQPYLMYAAYRRYDPVYCWDLRSTVDSPATIYNPGVSTEKTNQRLRFDVDVTGRRLAVGNQAGTLSIFNLEGGSGDDVSVAHATALADGGIPPTLSFPAHTDSIGSAAFHPTRSLLLTASGSRHFDAESESSDSESSSSDGEKTVFRPKHRRQPVPLDRSMKLWSFGEA